MKLSPLGLLEKFGDNAQILLPVVVGLEALLQGRYQREAIGLGISAGAQQIILYLLKKGAQRPRPSPHHLKLDSFPSGHTAGAFLSFGFVSALHYVQLNTSNKPYKSTAFKVTLLAGAILVGVSRYACSKHWPIDIVVGSLIGTFFGALPVYICQGLDFKAGLSS